MPLLPLLRRGRALLALAILAVVVPFAAACRAEDPARAALDRGDRAWVSGDRERALAEYRLAIGRGADSAAVYARVGHGYAVEGETEDARQYYQLAILRDSVWVDQAVADYVRIARDALERGDEPGVTAAIDAALSLRPGVGVPDVALPLARYYDDRGEYGRAVSFYERALASASGDEIPPLLLEMGKAYEALGDCRRALVFFERYLGEAPRAARRTRDEAEWYVGRCAYEVALDHRTRGNDDAALRHLQTTINLEAPRNLLEEAFFEKGEILLRRGECAAALSAFRRLLELDVTRSTALANRARRRIEQIRFGPRGEVVGSFECGGAAPGPDTLRIRDILQDTVPNS